MQFAEETVLEMTEMFFDGRMPWLFCYIRSVVDIYTAARIVAKKMKNVIVYEGAAHVRNLKLIFKKLGYTVKDEHINEDCM